MFDASSPTTPPGSPTTGPPHSSWGRPTAATWQSSIPDPTTRHTWPHCWQQSTARPTTYGFGPHPEAAIRAHEERIRRAIEAGEDPESDAGEGGGDTDFVPDIALADTDIVAGESFTFECLHTPGHISNHLCFALAEEQTLFPGDHVMGWSTTVIPAPDGDLADYMDGLERLIARSETTYRPTHGPAITDPVPFVTALLAHRRHREDQIVAALTDGPRTVAALVADIYADVDEKLHKAAGASVFAHLLALHRWGRATADPEPDPEAEWAIAQ